MERKPFFSIVVVSLNAEKLIAATINSVLFQTCDDYEIIVKDGCSTDRTLENIPKDEKICVYSEPDTGIYDAMNHATSLTSGKYILYLNCGDTFVSSNVLSKAKELIGDGDFGYVYGDWVRDGIFRRQPRKLTDYNLYRTPLCHQSIFFNGDDLRKTFHYDTKYRILADYNLEIEMQAARDTKHIDLTVCSYLGGGVSETKEGRATDSLERKEVIRSNYSKKKRAAFSLIMRLTFPKLRNRLVSSDTEFVKKTYQKIVNILNK